MGRNIQDLPHLGHAAAGFRICQFGQSGFDRFAVQGVSGHLQRFVLLMGSELDFQRNGGGGSCQGNKPHAQLSKE
jgi:hypothetical protein